MKKKTNTNTILRGLFVLISFALLFFAMWGKQIDGAVLDSIYNKATYLVAFFAAVVGYWKNNSFTDAAKEADEVLKILKRSYVDDGEVTEPVIYGEEEGDSDVEC